MPHKHSIKRYVEGGFYHLYNRGVEKRTIFVDEQDYAVFLHLLKYYLSPSDPKDAHPFLSFKNFTVVRPRPLTNLEKEIELLSFCLMPNHFHLLIKQKTIDGMEKLMSKVLTTYSMYFNKRYERVGHLFQGRYKAALVTSDSYLLHVSRYIHLNPSELTGTVPVNYPYSSYQYFLGLKKATWLKPDFILAYFDTSKLLPFLNKYPSYKDFVENYAEDSKEVVGSLAID